MKNILVWILLLASIAATSVSAQSQSYISFSSERMAQLREFGDLSRTSRIAGSDAVDMIMEEVRRAQGTEPYYRLPVSDTAIDDLHKRLMRKTGQSWSRRDVEATVDYVHAQMRESPNRTHQDMRSKLIRSIDVKRSSFHGSVAEISEARVRGMVLTKDPGSQTFDLTEQRRAPRSLQIKIEQSPNSGLRNLQDDLRNASVRARNGLMPDNEIRQLVESGRLTAVRHTEGLGTPIYITTSGTRVLVMPLKSFSSAAESQQYTRDGRAALGRLTGSPPARDMQLGRGMTRVVVPLAISVEIWSTMTAYQRYESGRISRAEFIEQARQTVIVATFTSLGFWLGSFVPVVGPALGGGGGTVVGYAIEWVLRELDASNRERVETIERDVREIAIRDMYQLKAPNVAAALN